MLQPDTYALLRRMLEVASTDEELEIVLRRFQAVYDANKDSTDRDDLFDAAWAMSGLAGLYARLHEPFLAEHAYLESIKRFEAIDMPLNAAAICEALAQFLDTQGRTAEAQAQLRDEITYLSILGSPDELVLWVEEELDHYRLTGELVEACNYRWYLPCDVDGYSFSAIEGPDRQDDG